MNDTMMHLRAGNDNAESPYDWDSMRRQLLAQWSRLKQADLATIGADRHRIALLVQREYGIPAPLVENYLANLERTLPIRIKNA